jgi:hypothetical protein
MLIEQRNSSNGGAGNGTIIGRGLFDEISLKYIFNNLKLPSIGMLLFLVGFNGMYFLPLIFPLALYQDALPSTYRYYLIAWAFVTAGGIAELFVSRFWLLRRQPIWAVLLLGSIVVMTIQGLFNGELGITILSRSFPFLWLLFVPAIGLRKQNWPWLWITLLFHIPISIVFSLYAFFIQNATSRWAILSLVGENFLMQATYMTVFMILTIPLQRSWGLKIISTLVLGVYALLSLFYFSRLNALLIPIIIFLVFYIYFRTSKRFETVKNSVLWLLPIALMFGLFWVAVQRSTSSGAVGAPIGSAYSSLVQRFTQHGTVLNTMLQNERFIELRAVTATMSPLDWLIGKGLGVAWSNIDFAGGELRYMVHNTWLNAFYWGGVGLFLAITIPLFWAIRTLLRSRDKTALSCAALMLIMYISFPAFFKTYTTLDWCLFCLVAGTPLWLEQSKKLKHPG